MIVTDERVARFVGQRCGTIIYPPYTCMGTEKDGAIINGVVFNCFTGADCHASIAGHGWTRGFLAEVGDYLFRQLRCERVTAVTEQPEVVRLAEKLGGQVEGLLRNHFGPGRHGFIVGILKDEYRW